MGHVRLGPVGVSPTDSHPKPAIQSLRSLQTMTVPTAGHTILSTQRGLSPSYTAEGLKMGGEDRNRRGTTVRTQDRAEHDRGRGSCADAQLGPHRKGTCHRREGSVQGG